VVVNDPGIGRNGEITNENPADEVVATSNVEQLSDGMTVKQ